MHMHVPAQLHLCSLHLSISVPYHSRERMRCMPHTPPPFLPYSMWIRNGQIPASDPHTQVSRAGRHWRAGEVLCTQYRGGATNFSL